VTVPIELGGGHCFVIAEVGLGHDGSLGLAHAFIDAIGSTGADAVKFQTHIAAAESTPAEPFRVPFSRQDGSRYAYWERMAFTENQWRGLADHARERQLVFLSSPFSLEAVDLLTRVGMPMWKIASGEVGNRSLIERVADTGQPVLLSSGMSALSELDDAMNWLDARGVARAVLQCTTAYPCPPESIGLNILQVLRERYACPVGLSDHSGTIYPGLAAVTLGADVVELHVTMSRAMFGPDVAASVTMDELRQLIDGVRFIERMQAHPVDKDAVARDMAPLRRIFTRSVVVRTTLDAGAVLTAEHLVAKKPGTGIPAERLLELAGRRLKRRVEADTLLAEDDLEEPIQ